MYNKSNKERISITILILSFLCRIGYSQLTDVFKNYIYERSLKISSYFAEYSEIIHTGNVTRSLKGKVIWNGKGNAWSEIREENRQVSTVIVFSNKTLTLIPNYKRPFSGIIYQIRIDPLVEKYGKIGKILLPVDLRDPFMSIDKQTLRYEGIKRIMINKFEKLMYKFIGEYISFDLTGQNLMKYEAEIYIDLETGLLRKLVLYNREKKFVLERVVEKVEINPQINEDIFKAQFQKEDISVKDITANYDKIFSEIIIGQKKTE